MQHPLSAKGVDASLRNSRCRARTVVETEIIFITGWIPKVPDFATVRGLQTGDPLLVFEPVEQDQFTIGNHRTAKPMPDSFLPGDARPATSPRFRNISSIT